MSPLHRSQQFFDNFSPASLEKLDEVYAPGIRFQDPLNRCEGIAALRRMFEDTFKQLRDLEFHVLHSYGTDQHALLRWRMHYQMRGKAFTIEGTTELHFNATGLIERQQDFWDPSFAVYGQFPGLGLAMRGIKRLVASK